MIDSINNSYPLPIITPTPQPLVSTEVAFYQHFLGGATPQQAETFIQGMMSWMNSVFASYADGEKNANDKLKKAEQNS